MRIWAAATVLLVGATLSNALYAMDMVPHRTKGGVQVVFASGDIEQGDADRLEALLDRGKIENRIIVLNSPGGDVLEAMMLGRTLRYFGFTTFLPERSECFSACAYVFLGGEYRVAIPGSRLGVHQFRGGHEDLQNQKGTQAFSGVVVEYLNDMKINPIVAQMALLTAPDQMYVFSAEQMSALNLLNEPAEKSFAKREAQKAGISEAEWQRRRDSYLASPALQRCFAISDMIQQATCRLFERMAQGISR